ncbi:MAG: tyrosine-type recombinase/integrase [Janthinobacterium lividum]
MSVYKPEKSAYWHYDFQFKGERFHGSTGTTTRRKAEAFERRIREEVADGSHGAVARLTLDAAALRWWQERGISRGDAVDVERRLERLVKLIGPTTPLVAIDQARVARAIETRKKQGMRRSNAKDAKVYYPSDATVNRDIIETLRPILKRARTHWSSGPHGLPDIDWRELRLSEPRPLSRMYTRQEARAWIKACPDNLGLAVDMLLTYGLRFGELFFPLDAVQLGDEPTLTLQKGRKRDVILHLPLLRNHADALAERVALARSFKLEHIWFTQITRTSTKGHQETVLEALDPHQVEYRISKAADAAGIEGGRRIHGARHHAGSAILKSTANLKSVQSLLGHASIHSSQRYAHILTGEIRQALEDQNSRNSPEPKASSEAK